MISSGTVALFEKMFLVSKLLKSRYQKSDAFVSFYEELSLDQILSSYKM